MTQQVVPTMGMYGTQRMAGGAIQPSGPGGLRHVSQERDTRSYDRKQADRLAEAIAKGEVKLEKPKCTATTKAGNPCKAFATETGLCVGHSKQIVV